MRSLYVKYPPESHSPFFPDPRPRLRSFILFSLFSRPSSWNNVYFYTHRFFSLNPAIPNTHHPIYSPSFPLETTENPSPQPSPSLPNGLTKPDYELTDSLFRHLSTDALNHAYRFTRKESRSNLGLECKKGVMLQSSLEDADTPVFFFKTLTFF